MRSKKRDAKRISKDYLKIFYTQLHGDICHKNDQEYWTYVFLALLNTLLEFKFENMVSLFCFVKHILLILLVDVLSSHIYFFSHIWTLIGNLKLFFTCNSKRETFRSSMLFWDSSFQSHALASLLITPMTNRIEKDSTDRNSTLWHSDSSVNSQFVAVASGEPEKFF